ncbi:cytochrome P450, putative [Ixodes scapularis]|nr:cytochrome P450, putative [Ixodes scapularis]|eukprot:XP_002404168.1 cytochrome P450, putative [Ixodes scapularis]
MTLDEITAQALLFFVAGTDTVMSSMTYATYFLALNPQCQERVLAEIDAAVEKRGVMYESLQDMPYLEACIKETMRLYSPDSVTMRMCTNETTVAGVRFKPGMNIDVPIAGVHYDPEFFPDPEKFQPERFLPENKGNLKPLTFLAFGAGPRNCVGMRLGILQVKVALACILEHLKVFKLLKPHVP